MVLLVKFPDYVFEWSGTADEMAIFFEGDADSTLVVVQPGGGSHLQ